MLIENVFDAIVHRAKEYKYSSMNYIDFDECKNSEILYDKEDLILLQDKSKIPSMIYFAANDFEFFLKILADISCKLRLHFVPREYAEQLERLGFIEWGEYTDFWNDNLVNTAAHFVNIRSAEFLNEADCVEVSVVSQKCRLQSRGFEGESPDWFAKWLQENKVIIQRKDSVIAGFCCVSIYNKGTTLWIREIAVDPVCQGTGLGKKLMEQAICYGIENGASKGFLLADVLNENAIGLYTKYNFYATGVDSELQMIRGELV
ncbi:hypothetical protein FACS18949_03250 [Clostridia bacterium]|nr:hypothetical protein FACS18949_03250 [Clostridia bacterium]